MIDQNQLIAKIKQVATQIELPNSYATKLFRHALVDTITNTVTVRDNGEIFVATGDIPAMWLRDSTFQILPYLSLSEEIPEIKTLVHGVLKQQFTYLLHDPYANAFNIDGNGKHYSQDQSNVAISPLVWERKFEIDSLCAPLFLAYRLAKTGYQKHLDERFWQVVTTVIETFSTEQHHERSAYYFKRSDCPAQDTLAGDGYGSPIGYTGMVWSGFRPSDDACHYGYFIPGNQFIVVVLGQLLELLPAGQSELKAKIVQLRQEIMTGIEQYGIMTNQAGERYYAYEVDGLGNQLFMDDANVPSLLSLPFLGYCTETDPLYVMTRNKILSPLNPYYYAGTVLSGIGSPHTPPDYVWPIALAMEGLTTTDLASVYEKIEQIAATDAQTLQCHEGIDVNDPTRFTREWFSWSNMTYCQLVLHYLTLVPSSKLPVG